MKKHRLFGLLGEYIRNYVLFALAGCLLTGFIILLLSARQLQTTTMEAEVERMRLAAGYMGDQIATLEDISYRVKTTAYYRPAYFGRNTLYERELIEDLAKYDGYSPLVSDIRLLYRQNPDQIYGMQYKSDATVYARNILGVSDVADFYAQLTSVTDKGFFSPAGHEDMIFLVFYLNITGSNDSSGDAWLCFVLRTQTVLNQLDRISGISTEGLSIYWDGAPLLLGHSPGWADVALDTEAGYLVWDRTLFVTDNAISLSAPMRSVGYAGGLQAFHWYGITAIVAILIILTVIAVIVAKRSYTPIAGIANRYNLEPMDELTQIDQLLSDLQESNRDAESKIAVYLDHMERQRKSMRNHLLLLLLNGTPVELLPTQMENVGLDFRYAYYCVITLRMQTSSTNTYRLLEALNSLSDEELVVVAIQINQESGVAAIVNTDDTDTIMELGEIVQDIAKLLDIETDVGMGIVVHNMTMLPISLQSAVSELYHDVFSDTSLFEGRALQELIAAIDAGTEEKAQRVWNQLFSALVRAYPMNAMRQSLFLHLAESVENVAQRHGLASAMQMLQRLLLQGNMERFHDEAMRRIGEVTNQVNKKRREDAGPRHQLTVQLLRFISENVFDYQFSQDTVARHFDISQRHVGRIVKENMGLSYKEYVVKLRIDYAKVLLTVNGLSVVETCKRIGYANVPHFIKTFKEITGVTPGNYKQSE